MFCNSFCKGNCLNIFKQLKFLLLGSLRLATSIVFVPSLRDIHHDYVYPQPPYTCTGKYEDMKVNNNSVDPW